MIISPRTAIEQGWVTGIRNDDKQVQPNAIDFTLDHIYTINHHNIAILSEDKKLTQMRGGDELAVSNTTPDGKSWWTLNAHEVYDGLSGITVDLPEGIACTLVIRSTFNRNGVYLTSGLYDSGYKGPIGFAIHNRSGLTSVEVGMRVGQIVFHASDKNGLYAGGWNHEAGTHWSTDTKNILGIEDLDVMQELNG
jgi:deoxycytidine triphosphate deaminase